MGGRNIDSATAIPLYFIAVILPPVGVALVEGFSIKVFSAYLRWIFAWFPGICPVSFANVTSVLTHLGVIYACICVNRRTVKHHSLRSDVEASAPAPAPGHHWVQVPINQNPNDMAVRSQSSVHSNFATSPTTSTTREMTPNPTGPSAVTPYPRSANGGSLHSPTSPKTALPPLQIHEEQVPPYTPSEASEPAGGSGDVKRKLTSPRDKKGGGEI